MSDKAECLASLRGFIERSERGELADAQAVIIQHALAAPDLPSRAQAMGELQADLAAQIRSTELESIQQAYYAVIDAMIDRTREAMQAPSKAR